MQLKLMIFAKSSLTSMHILNNIQNIFLEKSSLNSTSYTNIVCHIFSGMVTPLEGTVSKAVGTESSHQTISKIEKSATAIVNTYEKLKFIMTTQLLNVSPVLKIQKEK